MKNNRYIILGIVGVVALILVFTFMSRRRKTEVGEPAAVSIPTEGSATTEGEQPAGTLSSEPAKDGAATAPGSQPPSDVKTQKIEKFINTSRIVDEFKAMDELLDAQLEQIQSLSQLTAAEQEELEKLRQVVNGEKLLANYKKLLSSKLSEVELDEALEIQQNPTMKEITDSEVHLQTPEGQKELVEHWRNTKPESIPADRVKAIQAYDKATHKTEDTFQMIKSVGNMAGGKEGQKSDPAQDAVVMKSVEEANRIRLSKQFENATTEKINEATALQEKHVMQVVNQARTQVMSEAVGTLSSMVKEQAEKQQQEQQAK